MKMMSEISGEDYNLLGFSDDGFDRALRSFARGMLGTSSIKNEDAEFYVSSLVISSQNMTDEETWALSDLIMNLSYCPHADQVVRPSETFKKMFEFSIWAIRKYGPDHYTSTLIPPGISRSFIRSKVDLSTIDTSYPDDPGYSAYINRVITRNGVTADRIMTESMLKDALEFCDGYYDSEKDLLVSSRDHLDKCEKYFVYPEKIRLTAKMLLDPKLLQGLRELGKVWREEKDFYDSESNSGPVFTPRSRFPVNLDFNLLAEDNHRKEHARNREKTIYMSDVRYVPTGGAFG